MASSVTGENIEMTNPDPESIERPETETTPGDLDFCPRCGQKIEEIIWGNTNCPRCGLHFECC
jgi:hypothetical protein